MIKEYRIPMPLSVEEYRIAQLYMIAKKSRIESSDQSSGVEILQNEPYHNEETGEIGQYTIKLFYLSKHMPSFIKSLTNNSIFSMREEAWNSYPYTKTIYTLPVYKNFLMEVETYYLDDPGSKDNVFGLSENELQNRNVEFIDIAKDQPACYKQEEDPLYYSSELTKRGPLSENWLKEYTDEYKRCEQNGTKNKNNVMCAYKLCRVKVNVWGLRQRIERYAFEFARKTIVEAHRQAWCWQDEWNGLKMDDIREIEKETQKHLALRMNRTNRRRSSAINPASIEKENDFNIVSWRIGKIAKESESSDDEYFDANSLMKWSSMNCSNKLEEIETLSTDDNRLSISKTPNSLSKDSLALPEQKLNNDKCLYSALVFVVHGGHLLEYENESNNKYSDFSTICSTFEQTIRKSYTSLSGKLSMKLVCCPTICKSSIQFLSKLSTSYQPNGKFDHDSLPIDCLPLFATNMNDYQNQIDKTINSINQIYRDFIESDGKYFNGKISFICDFLGGILAYDSLCKTTVDNQMQENKSQANCQHISYCFEVDDIFLLGSPLSMILAYRKLTSDAYIQKPKCAQVYNLFHPMDRLVMRLEPLIESKFSEIASISVPKYNNQVLLQQITSIIKHLKFNQKLFAEMEDESEVVQHDEQSSSACDLIEEDNDLEVNLRKILHRWWGKNRIDYELYCPRGISHLPNNTLPVVFHSSFWESSDVASFVLDKLSYEIDPDHYCRAQKLEDKLICKPKEKWLKKSTSFKLKNISSNHRANDIIVKEGQEQTLTARFVYGPLDVVTLVGEKVDIYLLKDMNKDDWSFLGTEFTDKSGRTYHTIQEQLPLGISMQQQKVLAWLSNHCFPHGLIYFTGGLTTDPLKHKALYLERLQREVELSIYAAYGSAKDIWIYQSLGLSRDNIFIIGKVSKKQQHLANIITDGYATHLEELKLPGFCRRANNNKIELAKGNFGLCENFTGFCGIRLRRKARANRVTSNPVTTTSALNTPRLSNKFNLNTLNVSNSTLNSYKSISVNHSPTSTSSNLFSFFPNRTHSNKFK